MFNIFKEQIKKLNTKNDQKVGFYFLVFLFLIVALYSSEIYDSYHAPKNILLILFSVVIAPLSLLIYALKKKGEQVRVSILGSLLFARIIYLFLATSEKFMVIEFTLFIFISLYVVYLIGFNTKEQSGKETLKFLLSVIFVSGVFQSFVGAYQFLFLPELPTGIVKTNVIGSFGSSNALGNWLCLAMISGAFLFIKSKKKWLIGICLLFVGTMLVLTESRAAILTLVMTYSVWFVLSMESKRFVVFSAFILLSTATVLLFYYDIDSSMGRIYIWRISLEMFLDNYVKGIGIGNFGNEFISYQGDFLSNNALISPSRAAYVRSPHNEFFQAYIEGGIVGGSIFLASFIYCIYISIKKVLAENNALNVSIFLILIALFSHSLIDSILHFTPQLVLLYFLFGLNDESVSFKLKFNASLVSLFSIVLILYSSFFIYRQFLGRYFWDKGVDYSKLEKPLIAEHYFQVALDYLPDNGELLFNYGATVSLNGKHERGIYFMNLAQESFLDKNLLLSKSNALYELGEYKKSIEIADQVLHYYPDLLAPHLIKAQSYFELDDLEKSRESLLKCINEETNIRSQDTEIIVEEALSLWKKYQFGNY